MQVINKREDDRLKGQIANMSKEEKEKWNNAIDTMVKDLNKKGMNIKII